MKSTNYTSPRTGNTYEVKVTKEHRTDYREFMNPETRYEREYTQFTIYLGGRLVQFCFNEADIADAVQTYENPLSEEAYNVLHSRFD
jgi:hypothetical protein